MRTGLKLWTGFDYVSPTLVPRFGSQSYRKLITAYPLGCGSHRDYVSSPPTDNVICVPGLVDSLNIYFSSVSSMEITSRDTITCLQQYEVRINFRCPPSTLA